LAASVSPRSRADVSGDRGADLLKHCASGAPAAWILEYAGSRRPSRRSRGQLQVRQAQVWSTSARPGQVHEDRTPLQTMVASGRGDLSGDLSRWTWPAIKALTWAGHLRWDTMAHGRLIEDGQNHEVLALFHPRWPFREPAV